MQLTYAEVFRPRTAGRAAVYDAAGVAAAALFIAASAQVAFVIPGTPVPITGQTLAVLLTGVLLGGWRAATAVALYLAEGICGLPVFAGMGFGPARLAGPTGGYLVAFVPAAWLVGVLAQRGWDRRIVTAMAAMLLGDAVILLGGAAWLAVLLGWEDGIAAGIGPFVIGDILKVLIAASFLPAGWKLMARLRKAAKAS
jgi:biotin transport system substrate-specific component